MAFFKAIIREPPLQFLVAGVVLFGLFEAVSPDEPAALRKNVIRVTDGFDTADLQDAKLLLDALS